MNLNEKNNNKLLIFGFDVSGLSTINGLIKKRSENLLFFARENRSVIPLLSAVDSTNSKVERIMECDIKSVDERVLTNDQY